MKTDEQINLEREYNESFCNGQENTLIHLNNFVENTNSSALPEFLKQRFTNKANSDINAIKGLLSLESASH